MQVSKSLRHACQHLFVRQKSLQQLLPVWDGTMFKHELQSDIFKGTDIQGSNNRCQALLLVFGHEQAHFRNNSLAVLA